MIKAVILLNIFFVNVSLKPKYFILVNSVSCKSCVIELYDKLKAKKVALGYVNKNFFQNKAIENYYTDVINKVKFDTIIPTKYFNEKRYPCLVRIIKNDTVFFNYDTLFGDKKINWDLL